jgi:hypothetical protein
MGIPIVPAATILETSTTQDDVRAWVERYKEDPATYEAWLKANAGGRRG